MRQEKNRKYKSKPRRIRNFCDLKRDDDFDAIVMY